MFNKKLTLRAVAEVVGLLIGAGSMIYISRVVGPEYIGFNATTNAVILLISRFADGGLTPLVSQRLARDDERLGHLLAVTIPPKFVISALLIAGTFLCAHLYPMDPRLKFFVTTSVFMIFFEACTPAWVFIALGRINVASVIRIGQSLLYALAIVFLIRTPNDWRYVPLLTVFNSFVNFTLAVFFLCYFKMYSVETSLFRSGYLARLREYYREGFNFLKADLSTYVYTTSDRLILYYFTNPYTVGIYEAAYKIINPFYSIAGVISPTMFRDLAQSFKQGRIYPVMSKYLFSMSLLTIPLGFFMLYFSRFTIQLVYGPKFAESAPCLTILGFVITFGFTSGIIAYPFCAWNMSRQYASSVIWGNVINTVLNFTLIPVLGAVGAALATLAAKITVTVVAYVYFTRTTDYPVAKDFLYFFIASVVPLITVVLLAFVTVNSYCLAAVYGGVYLAIIAVMYKKYFKMNQNAPA